MAAAPSLASVTSWIKSDFARLMKNFKESDSVRFEDFSEKWKKMKMSFIFSGRETEYELREFVEDCFKIALDMCKPESDLQDRMCGLYILFSLYYKQPLDPFARIRVVLEQWRSLLELYEEIKKQQHLDAEYIFTKLRADGAFQFAVTTSRVILVPRVKQEKEDNTTAEAETDLRQEPSIISAVMEPDSIAQLSALHDQYHRMKCYLAGKHATEPDVSLALINNDLVQTITKTVASFEEYRKVRLDPTKIRTHKRKDSGTTTTSESEGDSDMEAWRPKRKRLSKVGENRASLKQRAYSMPVASRFSAATAHRTDVSDSAAEESEDLQSPPYKPSDTDDDEYMPGKSLQRGKTKKSGIAGRGGDHVTNKDGESSGKSRTGRGKGRGRGRGKNVKS